MKEKPQSVVNVLDGRAAGLANKEKTWAAFAFENTKTYHQTELKAHFGCVNCLGFSKNNELLASGGDDRRILLWPVSKALDGDKEGELAAVMRSQHRSNVFAVAFNASDQLVISTGNSGMILVHDTATGAQREIYDTSEPLYCADTHPDIDSIFVTGSDDGQALIYDLRSNEGVASIPKSTNAIHSVQYNPVHPQYLATVISRYPPTLWDCRQLSRPVLQYEYLDGELYHGMAVCFNNQGNRLLAIGRWDHPLVYDITSSKPLHHFNSRDYSCACTLKNCCWVGPNQEFIASGSDDFSVHLWEVPDNPNPDNEFIDEASKVLRGHRSIITQVQYNDNYSVIASSGIEKVVKLWSPFALPHPEGLARQPKERYIFLKGVVESGMSAGFLSDSHQEQSADEDPRMLCFFDNIIQQELGVHPSSAYSTLEVASSSSDEDDKVEVKQYLPSENQRMLVTITTVVLQMKKREEEDWKAKMIEKRAQAMCSCSYDTDSSEVKGSCPTTVGADLRQTCANCARRKVAEKKKKKSSKSLLQRTRERIQRICTSDAPGDGDHSSQSADRSRALRQLRELHADETDFTERSITPPTVDASGSAGEPTATSSGCTQFRRKTKSSRRSIRQRENSDSDS